MSAMFTGDALLALVTLTAMEIVLGLGLLFTISWIMGLTAPFTTVLGHAISGRDLILLGGGLFLIAKATWEIYDKVEAEHAETAPAGQRGALLWVLAQLLGVDTV